MTSRDRAHFIIKTRVFELCERRYRNLCEMAHKMGISVSQVYRVREGKRSINQKFIIGAKMAFPDLSIDELFYLEEVAVSSRCGERVRVA